LQAFHAVAIAPASTDRARQAHGGTRGPRPEFISVNGQCPVRSALRSDMRQSKRISGHAAATLPPHAPMNSPDPYGRKAGEAGFPN
jgi:hypothetical protein